MPAIKRRYNPVNDTFWNDKKVRAWPEDPRILALYLLTNQHRTAEGFYGLPIGLMCDDLGWDLKRLQPALEAIERDNFARYDPEARVVLIVKALKYHQPKGRTSIIGAVKAITTVHSPVLFPLLLEAAARYAPEFAEGIRDFYGPNLKGQGDVVVTKPNRGEPDA